MKTILGILVISLAACATAPARTRSDVPAATLQDFLACGVWEGTGRSSYGPYAIRVIVTRSGPWTHALSIIRPEGVNREIRASYSIGGAKGGPGELLLFDDLGVTHFDTKWIRRPPSPEIAFSAANEASRRDVRLEWLADGRRRSYMKVKLARPIPGILTESEFEQTIALTKPSSCEVSHIE